MMKQVKTLDDYELVSRLRYSMRMQEMRRKYKRDLALFVLKAIVVLAVAWSAIYIILAALPR